MNFFEQQDAARRNARMLLLLFLAAVFLLILLTNALIAAFFYFSQDYNVYAGSREGIPGFFSYFTWARYNSFYRRFYFYGHIGNLCNWACNYSDG